MEIIIGMLVSNKELQNKYRKIIEYLFLTKSDSPVFVFFDSLANLNEEMLYGQTKVDILIMPASTKSFEFAKSLRMKDRNCLILYPAKNMELVLDAFESMPMAYVLPQNSADNHALSQAILKAVDYIHKSKQEISFETKSKLLHYSLYEIDYFESQYRIVHIVKRNGSTEAITSRLDQVEASLPIHFYRCHQSYLVNMDNIDYIDKSSKEIYFYSGQCVPSSKKLFTDFLHAYHAYKMGENEIE